MYAHVAALRAHLPCLTRAINMHPELLSTPAPANTYDGTFLPLFEIVAEILQLIPLHCAARVWAGYDCVVELLNRGSPLDVQRAIDGKLPQDVAWDPRIRAAIMEETQKRQPKSPSSPSVSSSAFSAEKLASVSSASALLSASTPTTTSSSPTQTTGIMTIEEWGTCLHNQIESQLKSGNLLPDTNPPQRNSQVIQLLQTNIENYLQGRSSHQRAAAWKVMANAFGEAKKHCTESLSNAKELEESLHKRQNSSVSSQEKVEKEVFAVRSHLKALESQLAGLQNDTVSISKDLLRAESDIKETKACLDAVTAGEDNAIKMFTKSDQLAVQLDTHLKETHSLKNLSHEEVVEFLLRLGIDANTSSNFLTAVSELKVDGAELDDSVTNGWGIGLPSVVAKRPPKLTAVSNSTTPPTQTEPSPQGATPAAKEVRALLNLKKLIHVREHISRTGDIPVVLVPNMMSIDCWHPKQVEKWLISQGLSNDIANKATCGGVLPGWAFLHLSVSDLLKLGIPPANRTAIRKLISVLNTQYKEQQEEYEDTDSDCGGTPSGSAPVSTPTSTPTTSTPKQPSAPRRQFDPSLSIAPNPVGYVNLSKDISLPENKSYAPHYIDFLDNKLSRMANKNSNSSCPSDDGDGDCLPYEFICPITQEVMKDPVLASDGYLYEREAIVSWMSTGRHTSPQTNLPLKSLQLIPCNTIKSAITEWTTRHKNP
ncbi:hypothetical protein Pelo_5183 [Pelomyxa schiedti]|nr:hypothetical protein Pelo_5183 [Pelomyxa schiedti]